LAGAELDRAGLGVARHPHRHPHRARAEHRSRHYCGADRRWGTRHVRIPRYRTDGNRPRAAGCNPHRRPRLLPGRRSRCPGGVDGPDEIMITLEHLTKQFGAATVVNDVSLQIESNTITVIVGSSGSGKSTLLRMINRLIEPTRGRVLIEGKDTRGE